LAYHDKHLLFASMPFFFFTSRSNGMATVIGSLAAGMDEHVIRLGIGRMVLRKHVETLTIFFRCTPLPM
jgi:hypothetical protein